MTRAWFRGRNLGSAPAALAASAALAAAAVITSPGGVEAQNRVGFEGRAGAGLPAFDLADRADAGPAVGLDLTYALTDRVALVAGGDVEFLEGAGATGTDRQLPDLTAWHYGAGIEAQLLDPVTTYWRLTTGAGLGGSTYDADGGESRSAFSVYGSLELGYELSTEADLFLGVKSWLGFAGQEDVAILDEQPLDIVFPPTDPLHGVDEVAWSFPVMAGLRLHF